MALTAGGKSIRTSVSIRLPDDVAKSLEDLAATIDSPKTYVIRKAQSRNTAAIMPTI